MIRPDFRRDAEIGAQESRAQFVTSLVTNLGATVRGGLEETASRGTYTKHSCHQPPPWSKPELHLLIHVGSRRFFREARSCGLRPLWLAISARLASAWTLAHWHLGIERAVVSPAAISQSENAGDKVSGHPAYQTRFPVQLSLSRDHRLRRFAVRVGNTCFPTSGQSATDASWCHVSYNVAHKLGGSDHVRKCRCPCQNRRAH
jgi:hypothetical protein